MTKAVAIGFRIHVKPDVREEEKKASSFGLVIPDIEDAQRNRLAVDSGVVVDMGPEAFKAYGGEPWCKVGDHIVYARYAGRRILEGEDSILVINDEDVVAKLED